jgi:putative MATE family efflux protein
MPLSKVAAFLGRLWRDFRPGQAGTPAPLAPGGDKTKIPLTQWVLPMLVENVVRTSLLSVDQLMLYAYSEKAVAALGAVNQMAFFIQIVYMMVGIGASIHISQNLGAGKNAEAGKFSLAGLVLIGGFGLALSAAVVLLAAPILDCFHLEPEVRVYAWQFLALYGGGSIFLAINIVQASILRAHGYAREPMAANILALVFTILGNALCLFGPWGFPKFGVPGVAVVTVLSQCLVLWLLGLKILRHKDIELPWREFFHLPRAYYTGILAIGVPSAGENLAYSLGQILIIRMIAALGTASLAAYSLVTTLSRYIFISGISIGSGTQIKVGYYVGSNQHDEAHRRVYRYFAVGFTISAVAVILLNVFKGPIIGIFTSNPEIVTLTSAVFWVSLALEPGRNFNTIIIPGLKGAGDVRFPVIIGMLFMWGVGVGGAYLLGLHLGWGLVGIWIAMAADEWSRGLVMLWRWRSGQWRKKRLV